MDGTGIESDWMGAPIEIGQSTETWVGIGVPIDWHRPIETDRDRQTLIVSQYIHAYIQRTCVKQAMARGSLPSPYAAFPCALASSQVLILCWVDDWRDSINQFRQPINFEIDRSIDRIHSIRSNYTHIKQEFGR